MTATHRRTEHASPRRTRALAAAAAALLLGGALCGSAAADGTPAPTGGRTAPGAIACPPGQTPTLVTAPAAAGSRATPNPTVFTRTDGSTVQPVCAIAPPTPLPGRAIAPRDTVGGARLAGRGSSSTPLPRCPPRLRSQTSRG